MRGGKDKKENVGPGSLSPIVQTLQPCFNWRLGPGARLGVERRGKKEDENEKEGSQQGDKLFSALGNVGGSGGGRKEGRGNVLGWGDLFGGSLFLGCSLYTKAKSKGADVEEALVSERSSIIDHKKCIFSNGQKKIETKSHAPKKWEKWEGKRKKMRIIDKWPTKILPQSLKRKRRKGAEWRHPSDIRLISVKKNGRESTMRDRGGRDSSLIRRSSSTRQITSL